MEVGSILLMCVIGLAQSCKVLNWSNMSMEEILTKADIVVYGKEIERFPFPDVTFPDRKDATMEVYCVMKNDDEMQPITEMITIEQVYPRTSCSGTRIRLHQDVVLALSRTHSGNFEWHEVNVVPNGAAFHADNSTLRKVAKLWPGCTFQLPLGRDKYAQHTCPVKQTHASASCTYTSTASMFHTHWVYIVILHIICLYTCNLL